MELFTSEGCSSCPPADALLAKFDGRRADEQTLMVGLSEHVTYWDRLGWKDPFSQDLFTARQEGYGRRFGLDGVYTPQVVVNGAAQLNGSDGQGILDAVKGAGKKPGVGLRIVSAEVVGQAVRVGFALDGAMPKGADLYAAIAQDKAAPEVRRGENGGRTLNHVAVVRSLTRVGKVGAETSFEVALPGGIEGGRHVVVFVQEGNYGRVVAVGSQGF